VEDNRRPLEENRDEDDMSQKTVADVFRAAETLLGELAATCAGCVPGVPCLISRGFDELSRLIEALPPGTPGMEFYRNWARDSRRLWEGDEGQAAGYQLTQMRRKLGRLQEEWP
jgi:hypothetical protein